MTLESNTVHSHRALLTQLDGVQGVELLKVLCSWKAENNKETLGCTAEKIVACVSCREDRCFTLHRSILLISLCCPNHLGLSGRYL